MNSIISFLAAPVIVLATTVFATDAVKLTRTYKDTESTVYKVTADADVDGQIIKAEAEIQVKVTEIVEGGKARVVLSTKKLSVTMDGNSMGDTPLEDFSATFDAQGIPEKYPGGGPEWLYTLASLGGILPAKEVEVGASFEFDWATKEKTSTLKGKGKLVEVTGSGDNRSAKIEYELDVRAEGESGDAKGTLTSTVSLSDGRVESSEGKLTIPEGSIKFKVVRS